MAFLSAFGKPLTVHRVESILAIRTENRMSWVFVEITLCKRSKLLSTTLDTNRELDHFTSVPMQVVCIRILVGVGNDARCDTLQNICYTDGADYASTLYECDEAGARVGSRHVFWNLAASNMSKHGGGKLESRFGPDENVVVLLHPLIKSRGVITCK